LDIVAKKLEGMNNMSQKVIELNCPGCGERVSISQKICKYCHRPVLISTFNSINEMSLPDINKYAGSYRKSLVENPDNQDLNFSLGACYLKLKMYDKASECFETAMKDNFDNSETFFYAAVSLLKGKRPFLQTKPIINKIEECINAAIMIEPRGIYYYFHAYVSYDYYAQKGFKASPSYIELLRNAADAGYSIYDTENLFSILNTSKPSGF
jgi:tetratricopeptide (TPR) repeat protein